MERSRFGTEEKSPFIYVHTQLLLKCDKKRRTKFKNKEKRKSTYSHRYITSSTGVAMRENFCLVPSEGNAKLRKRLQMVSWPTDSYGHFASDLPCSCHSPLGRYQAPWAVSCVSVALLVLLLLVFFEGRHLRIAKTCIIHGACAC